MYYGPVPWQEGNKLLRVPGGSEEELYKAQARLKLFDTRPATAEELKSVVRMAALPASPRASADVLSALARACRRRPPPTSCAAPCPSSSLRRLPVSSPASDRSRARRG
jgi:hypothetical protein